MDFYTNIHKSRGDRGSSITASADAVSPSIIPPEEEEQRTQLKLLAGGGSPESGGGGRGQHYLLEVFNFIARMMFLISTAAIN